jgi:hypothetical protein
MWSCYAEFKFKQHNFFTSSSSLHLKLSHYRPSLSSLSIMLDLSHVSSLSSLSISLDLSRIYFNASPDMRDTFIVLLSDDGIQSVRTLSFLHFTLIHSRLSLSLSSIVLGLSRLYLNTSPDIPDTFIVSLSDNGIQSVRTLSFPQLDSAR